MQKNLDLFKDRKFWPLMVTMFCGCLNDCILKNALIILVIYKIASSGADLLVLLINSIFILPFIIFAGIAGQVSDKYEKAYLIKIIKFSEIFIILLGLVGFYYSNIPTLLLSIILMGIHSTFFGTLKLSIIPDQLDPGQFLKANGYIESATFVGVLIGTLLGGLYNWNQKFVMVLMLFVAFAGFLSSLFIIKSPNYDPSIIVNTNLWKGGINLIKYCYTKPKVFLSILGISWFWFMGASILSQIPILTKEIFKGDESIANFFLGVFSVGTGVGSLICGSLLHNKLSTKYIFGSAVGMSILGIDLFFITKNMSCEAVALSNIATFLSKLHNWHIVLNFLLFSMLGGLYVVPLYTLLQSLSISEERSRMIAANNLMNSIFIILSAVIIGSAIYIGCSTAFIILIISLLNAFVASYIYAFLPAKQPLYVSIIAKIVKFFFDVFYKVEVKGLLNFYKAGNRVVIICNHTSYLDAALLTIYLPEMPVFAINKTIAQSWWVRIILKLVKAHPLDNNNASAIKNLIKEVKQNKKVAIFPEGRLSTTGKLMKTYAGPFVIAQKSQAKILPIIITGPEHTIFATARSMPIKRLLYNVKINVMEPLDLDTEDSFDKSINKLRGMSSWVYETMIQGSLSTISEDQSLFSQVILAAKIYGMNYPIIWDAEDKKFTYGWIISTSLMLADQIKYDNYTGIFLDNSIQSYCLFFGIQIKGSTPVLLDFCSNPNDIVKFCKKSNLKNIYLSKQLVDKCKLHDLLNKLSNFITINFIEDILQNVGIRHSIKYFIKTKNLSSLNKKYSIRLKEAVVFYSADRSKITLSHDNIAYNTHQMFLKLDLNTNDKIFHSIPLSDITSLQITMGALISGIKLFLYPVTKETRAIPEAVYLSNSTILFGTDYSLSYYAKMAHSYDFNSLRYVFSYGCGLRPCTQKIWQQNFGIRIFEMYTLKEASGILSFNTKMEYKQGSVGKLLPGIEYKLRPTKGFEGSGRLMVRGRNIVSQNTSTMSCAELDNNQTNTWHDTKDIVSIDSSKYLTIVGKASQFFFKSQILISLALIEQIALDIDPLAIHVAVRVKSSTIVLFTMSKKINKRNIAARFRKAKISSLNIPNQIYYQDKIPFLANYKIDYASLKKIALKRINYTIL